MAVPHVHRIRAHLILSPPLIIKSEPRPQVIPPEPQGMPSFACHSADDLLRNVRDLTLTTKIIGTKPFAYGGYSDIWRGFEWGSGATRDVAIKIIRVATRQTVTLERLKKRISREILGWNAVGHQNILPFYGLFWVDGRDELPAMVYPYCEAGTCSEFLDNNADADRMAIIRQVADGLHHLHCFTPPVAHGDIKAANILMKQDGTPLIADFGLSRLVMEFATGLTTSSSRGSYRWMAPELFGGDSHFLVPVTPASDVWAFGCLCLEILLGVLPWALYRSDVAIMLAVFKDRQPPPLPTDTEALPIGHIMRHCWVYEASERPSMLQLVNALSETDPEHLHCPTCVLLPSTALSDSPPAIRNSDLDSFTPGFSDSPLISSPSDSRTITRTKTPIAPIPLFSPREAPSHRSITPVSNTGATPYLDTLSFTPSDSGSSGLVSRDEPSLFESPAPLLGFGPRRPYKSIREMRQNSQPMWPRTPSSGSSNLPQISRPAGNDEFRHEAWRGNTANTTPSSTRPSTRPPSQASLHIWTPPRTDSRHSLHAPSMSPLSQYSSDHSATTTSLATPVTPNGLPPYSRHSHLTTCVPSGSPDHTLQGHYYAAPPSLPSHASWSPTGAVPRDFQFPTSKPIRISTPDGRPVTLPERKSSSSSPIKAARSAR